MDKRHDEKQSGTNKKKQHKRGQMKGLLFTEKQVKALFSSFFGRIQWKSCLVKIEGGLYTTVVFASLIKLVSAVGATEMGQTTRVSSGIKSGIWFDLQQISFN